MTFVRICIVLAMAATGAHAQVVKAKEPNLGGELDLATQDPAEALKRLVVQDGFEVSLFASEKDFPLHNPVSLTFDAQGRLWVATMPSYPQRLPDEDPNDILLILEDTDGDGKADTHTVFADRLHVPTGFELGDGGAYIAQQPNLIFAKDTDGDGVADYREVILHGFGTEDSHHSISAFTWGPGGGLYFQEGTFHHTQVETPHGPVRLVNAGVFRFDPPSHRLDVFVSYGFANPWGHVFDRWGQNFIADASGGANYFGSAMTGNIHYPDKHASLKVFTSVVRPTAGCEFVRSSHFPDEAQGNFLVNNCIGFQGIKQHRVIEEDSGFTSEEVEPLLYSTDINFRPVDIQFGPDGALYIVDWFNPLVGHMQYSLRDERRDHGHGRIWRITYKGKPLVVPPKIADATVPELLENLKLYEDRARYRTRIELRNREWNEVAAALDTWVAGLDKSDPEHERHLLEALWVSQIIHRIDTDLLARVLNSPEPRARAAATRVVRYWRDKLPNAQALLKERVNDASPRTRLEAVLALSYIETNDSAATILEMLKHPTDYYLDYVLEEALKTLKPVWLEGLKNAKLNLAAIPGAEQHLIDRVSARELRELPRTPLVLEALATRSGVPKNERDEALRQLAKLSDKSPIAQLLDTYAAADTNASQDAHLLHELGMMLLEHPAKELQTERAAIEHLAKAGRATTTRVHAQAALALILGGAQAAWDAAAANPLSQLDLMNAVGMVPDEKLRADFYPLLAQVLRGGEAQGHAINAQFIRIELPGRDRVLTVAEVEAFENGVNVARDGRATQSSTGSNGFARRAIDGNTSGAFNDNGQTHTNPETNPWLEIDLKKPRNVERIRIWNRTDGDLGARLQGYTLTLLDADRKAVFSSADNPAPDTRTDLGIAQSMKLAALAALPATRPPAADALPLLIETAGDPAYREAALLAAAQLPLDAFDSAMAQAFADTALAHIQAAPTSLLSSRGVQNAFQLGQKLADALPETQALEVKLALANLGVTVIHIRPIPHKMLYDLTEFSVPAGKPVEIVFENTDIMPHNLVFTTAGKMEEVGMMAEAMALEPDAQARHYIPDSPHVLHYTKLLFPGESETLTFVASDTPGDMPFVCTYPGHWMVMNGTMRIVAALDRETLAAQIRAREEKGEAGPARKMVKDWVLEDLRENIEMVQQKRNHENGKAMFEVAGCAKCHAFDGGGVAYGPDLVESAKKYGTLELLQHILEPSTKVDEAWDAYVVETADFETYTGFIVKQDDNEIHMKANQEDPEDITVIARDNIDRMEKSKLSTMPSGLLVTLTEEDILDLLAYIQSGGDAHRHHFQH